MPDEETFDAVPPKQPDASARDGLDDTQSAAFVDLPTDVDFEVSQIHADGLPHELQNPATRKDRLLGSQLGPYHIVDKLAEGGMGAVYLAQQNEPIRRRVALKVIKGGADSQQIVARFEAERQALAMMDHPNIARIIDGGTTNDGSPYFVMELVEGVPLTRHCNDRQLSIRERLELFVPVCRAVHHAHGRGILHRDLKPSNVLVAVTEDSSSAKVIDFGLAKATDHQTKLTDHSMFTQMGQLVGTLQYMSPEQAEMNPAEVDNRTDIYSLGVMLYELLTGSTPLDSKSVGSQPLLKVLQSIRENDPPRPSARLSQAGIPLDKVSHDRKIPSSQLRQVLRGELDWIVMKAIEKDRTRRYDSAGELAKDIQRFLNDEVVQARPPSLVYRSRKLLKRNRNQAIAAASVVGVLLLALVVTPVFVSLRREAVIAKAEQKLDSALAEFQLDSDDWQQSKDVIEQLRAYDPSRADLANVKLSQRTLEKIEQAIERPRLQPSDRKKIGDAIDRLRTSGIGNDQRLTELQSQLDELAKDWELAFSASEKSPADFVAMFPTATLTPGEGKLSLATSSPAPVDPAIINLSAKDWFEPLTLSRYQCTGDTRVSATFTDWQPSYEIGITLHGDISGGYDFVLRPAGQKEGVLAGQGTARATLGDAIRRGFSWVLEIRRGETTVLNDVIPSDQFRIGDSIRLTAMREGNALSVRVNDSAEHRILEPFAYRSSDFGRLGLRGTAGVSITEIVCESRKRTGDHSPLLSGDAHFSRGDLQAALQQYQRQEEAQKQLPDSEADSMVLAESQYKIAVCLDQLGRSEEARLVFQKLTQFDDQTWSSLAGIRLLDLAIAEQRTADADAIFSFLRTTGRLSKAAQLVSPDVKTRIIASGNNDLTLGALLKPDAKRLSRIQRSAEIDRILSFDGVGTMSVQVELCRALRAEGRIDESAAILARLWENTRSWDVLRRYLRALRVTGRSREALAIVNGILKEGYDASSKVLIFRALIHISLGDMIAAEHDIAAAKRTFRKVANDIFFESTVTQIDGFLKYRRGDHAEAAKDWRRSYQLFTNFRQTGNTASDTAKDAAAINALMMGGLTQQSNSEDIQSIFNRAADEFGTSGLLTLLPEETLTRVLNQMWRSEKGMKWAERLAFDQVNLQDRITVIGTLAAYELMIQGAFNSVASEQDRNEAWAIADRIVQGVLIDNSLSMAQAMQLGLTWKGTTNFLGWSGVNQTLDDSLRARLAYVMGHRMIGKGDLASAKTFFDESQSLEGADPQTRQLAAKSLELLEAKKGIIKFNWNGDDAIEVAILDKNEQAIETVNLKSDAVVEVPPGEYSIKVDQDASVALLPKSPLVVRLGSTIDVPLQHGWTPSNNPSTISGVLSHPATRTDATQWQVVRSRLQGNIRGIAFHPDGKRITLAGSDGMVRTSDIETFQTQAIISHDPSEVLSVDWSPDGKTLAFGDYKGNVYFSDSEQSVPKRCDLLGGFRVNRIRWNPAGTLLAVCDKYNLVTLLNRDGSVNTVLRQHTGEVRHLDWSPSGNRLVTAGIDQTIVWDTQAWKPLYVCDDIVDARTAQWSRDERTFAVATGNRVMLRDAGTGDLVRQITMPEGKEPRAVTWTSDPSILVMVGYFHGHVFWNTDKEGDEAQWSNEKWGYGPLRWHPKEEIYVTGNLNGPVFVRGDDFDGNDFERLNVTTWNATETMGIEVSKSGRHLIVVSRWGNTQRLDLATGEVENFKTDSLPQSVANHPHQPIVALGRMDGRVVFCNESLEIIADAALAQTPVERLQWTLDGKTLIGFSKDRSIWQINVSINTDKPEIEIASSSPMQLATPTTKERHFALHPSGKEIAVADFEGQLSVIAVKDGTTIRKLKERNGLQTLAFRADGKVLAGFSTANSEFWNRDEDWRFQSLPTPGGPFYVPRPILPTRPQSFVVGCTDGQLLNVIVDQDVRKHVVSGIRRDSEMLHAIAPSPKGSLWVLCREGIIREVDPSTGRVLSAVVVNRDGTLAYFSAGGQLLTDKDSVKELTCIVEQSGGVRSAIPAREFYSNDQ
ncbi:serine/threonine-protein kinase [Planctomycetes bacterium K23_9]|uniref:Serine/threonine-protein kinase PknB n=1 Tax=Stieleria marina TaxID=1930275 RepID=A0A517NX56_9BACT|nr:Serine/threonine-protein kinase PknB [Planctomycetes bacterium K23_9]